ncbi:lysozyme [Trinickia fusca]|uniref:Lysozyme n=1 Tax=Trinickia fusca TaxID=2419777 RepID=A0A494X1M5_9BURK|nr:lysozyme [Trinickia fusca]RKP44617.1 lysozyme [Trinickia fusca]
MLEHPERTGPDGIDLIKHFEGLRLTRYLDAVGKPTIGYGHLILPNEKFAAALTTSAAESLLKQDLRKHELALRKLVRVPITQQQFDALMAFVFNLGPGRLQSSTLLRCVNASQFKNAADQFLVWNKAGGKPLAGLTRRRQAERKLFLS